MDKNEPLITFNSRYEAIHYIAFGFNSEMQSHKPQLTLYASKLPHDTSKKLLKKGIKGQCPGVTDIVTFHALGHNAFE